MTDVRVVSSENPNSHPLVVPYSLLSYKEAAFEYLERVVSSGIPEEVDTQRGDEAPLAHGDGVQKFWEFQLHGAPIYLGTVVITWEGLVPDGNGGFDRKVFAVSDQGNGVLDQDESTGAPNDDHLESAISTDDNTVNLNTGRVRVRFAYAPADGTPIHVAFTKTKSLSQSDQQALKDWILSNYGHTMIDTGAYTAYLSGLGINVGSREQFLASATTEKAILRHARLLGYTPGLKQAATTEISVKIRKDQQLDSSDVDTLFPINGGPDDIGTTSTPWDIEIPAGTQFIKGGSPVLVFESTEAVSIKYHGLVEESGTRYHKFTGSVFSGEETLVEAYTSDPAAMADAIVTVPVKAINAVTRSVYRPRTTVNQARERYRGTGEDWQFIPIDDVDFVPDYLDSVPAVELVRAEDKNWTPVETLNNSLPESTHYRVEVHDDRTVGIRFGNGVTGKKVTLGEKIIIFYKSGGGLKGRIPPNAIETMDQNLISATTRDRFVFSISGNTAGVGGNEREDPQSIVQKAPDWFAAGRRAVNRRDWRAVLSRLPQLITGMAWGEQEEYREVEGEEVVTITASTPETGIIYLNKSPIKRGHTIFFVKVGSIVYSAKDEGQGVLLGDVSDANPSTIDYETGEVSIYWDIPNLENGTDYPVTVNYHTDSDIRRNYGGNVSKVVALWDFGDIEEILDPALYRHQQAWKTITDYMEDPSISSLDILPMKGVEIPFTPGGTIFIKYGRLSAQTQFEIEQFIRIWFRDRFVTRGGFQTPFLRSTLISAIESRFDAISHIDLYPTLPDGGKSLIPEEFREIEDSFGRVTKPVDQYGNIAPPIDHIIRLNDPFDFTFTERRVSIDD